MRKWWFELAARSACHEARSNFQQTPSSPHCLQGPGGGGSARGDRPAVIRTIRPRLNNTPLTLRH